MPSSTLLEYIHGIIARVPLEHWVILGTMALVLPVFLLVQKKSSTFGAFVLGLSIFVGLLLLDMAVVNRLGKKPSFSTEIDLMAEISRLLHGGKYRSFEMLSNILAFIPYGFFLFEFLSSTKKYSTWRQIGLVTLFAFGLSMCIECLQLILHVGFFELTDLFLNAMGAGFGASLALLMRLLFIRKDNHVRWPGKERV